MGEIFRIPKREGKVGRPKKIEVRGAKIITEKETRIVGAPVQQERIKTLDSRTKTEQPGVEIVQHEETIVPLDPREKPDPFAPQIRIRVGDRKAFDKVKRLED